MRLSSGARVQQVLDFSEDHVIVHVDFSRPQAPVENVSKSMAQKGTERVAEAAKAVAMVRIAMHQSTILKGSIPFARSRIPNKSPRQLTLPGAFVFRPSPLGTYQNGRSLGAGEGDGCHAIPLPIALLASSSDRHQAAPGCASQEPYPTIRPLRCYGGGIRRRAFSASRW